MTVYGTVTEEASLFVVKYFVIKDDTGSIKVTTDRTLPKQGEKLRVTGTVESIEFGPGDGHSRKERDREKRVAADPVENLTTKIAKVTKVSDHFTAEALRTRRGKS